MTKLRCCCCRPLFILIHAPLLLGMAGLGRRGPSHQHPRRRALGVLFVLVCVLCTSNSNGVGGQQNWAFKLKASEEERLSCISLLSSGSI